MDAGRAWLGWWEWATTGRDPHRRDPDPPDASRRPILRSVGPIRQSSGATGQESSKRIIR